MILETRSTQWPDEAACALSARHLAAHSGVKRAFIELRGPLGAGKTTFVRHLLQALGVEGRIKSPTYAVMESYELPAPAGKSVATGTAWHFDFYRFTDPREWEDAGFRDIFAAEGLKLAEWPEQVAGLLPTPDLVIDISPMSAVGGPATLSPPASAGDSVSGPPSTDIPGADSRTVTFTAFTPAGQELLA